MNIENIIAAAAVGLIGAIIAAFSALVKSWYLNRDMRARAKQQLELASARAEFAIKWHDASIRLAEDPAAAKEVDRRAKDELEIAYRHAKAGFEEGRSAIETTLIQRSAYPTSTLSIGSAFLIRRGLRTASKFVIGFFYVSLYFLWVICIPLNDPPEDDIIHELWIGILVGIVGTIVLRIVFGKWVDSLERNQRDADVEPARDLPPPVSGTA